MFLILFLAGIAFVNGSDKNCTAYLQCEEETYWCTAGEECNIDCGEEGCKSAIFYCADGHDCNVNCNFGIGACFTATIHCPENATCNIDCGDSWGCFNLDVFGGNLSNSVAVSGCDDTYNCNRLRLDCPIDGEYGDCYIGGEYGTYIMDLYLSNMEFDDVILDFTSAKINRTDYPGNVYCKNGTGTSEITVNLTIIDGDCFTWQIGNYTNIIDCRDTPDNWIGYSYDPSCYNDSITCSGDDNCYVACGANSSCAEASIECTDDYDCYVNCGMGNEKTKTCQDTIILCPNNADCIVDCNAGKDGCSGIKINATQSNSLMILDCSLNDIDSITTICQDMQIYCPENGICYIEGGDNNLANLDIWVESDSYSDLVFNYTGDNDNEIGQIYCGYNNKFSACRITDTNPLNCKGKCTSDLIDNTNFVDCSGDSTCYADLVNCPDNNSRCYVGCGSERSCQYADINCADDYDCYVNCGMGNGKRRTCSRATINCPNNGDCIVDCNAGGLGCRGLQVKAKGSNSLSILGCSTRSGNDTLDNICEYMNIWCPEDGRCYLEGDKSLNNLKIWVDSDDSESFDNLVFNFTGNKENQLGDIYCQYSNSKYSCSIESLDPLDCKGSCTSSSKNGTGGGNDNGDSANQLSAMANVFCFVIVAFILELFHY